MRLSLAELRRAAGLSQGGLARELMERYGVSSTRQLISNYERGVNVPNVIVARRIAKVLGVPLDAIEFGGKPKRSA